MREYERHVEAVSARDPQGLTLELERTDKNRWRIATRGAAAVTVHYRVYGREMSVRTNWIEADFAMLNGAPTFLTLADETEPRPHEVTIVPAKGWQRSITGLAEVSGGMHRYRAQDFDTLVDSPILVGNPSVYEFTVDGKPHYFVNQNQTETFDGARAAGDLEAIVREHRRFWGSLPYDKYVFINMIVEAGGGLEHKNSTLLMSNRWVTRSRASYLAWLEMASHEFFHTWNAKRLRPEALGPFDYENENFTRSLWVVEGITDYYGELAVLRAGLSTRDEYLRGLSNHIDSLQSTPGRLVRSVEEASFDAWIRYYRPDENSVNVDISYYTKGTVIAFLLDARIRAVTDGRRSLDDVMRLAFDRFSGHRGYTRDEFRQVAEEVAGVSLDAFWQEAIANPGEVNYEHAQATFGLRFRPADSSAGRPWLGLTTRDNGGRLIVARVLRDSPAHVAGINVDDEILAIDDVRVRADQLTNRLGQYRSGERVSVLVARRQALRAIDITLGSEPARAWQLEAMSDGTEAQRRYLAAWLGRTPE